MTTIFKMEDGLPISLPRVETAKKQKREKIMHIWIDAGGNIAINDKLVRVIQIGDILVTILSERPDLIIAFMADDRAPYGVVSDVMDQLKEANAIRVSFTSDPKSANAPRRRQ